MPEIIGQDRIIKELKEDIPLLARRDISILLFGPTGTGKELFADLYHKHSPRKKKPIKKINCAGIPETLLESELFGHEKGSFTGADYDKEGLIETCDKGILFLDEIGEMSSYVQAKLLRVIEDGEVKGLGSTKTKKVDVIYLAATTKRNEVRDDLKFRFSAHKRVPPLISRLTDLPLLIRHFLKNSPIRAITEGCLLRLFCYEWPGNIRELDNVLRNAVAYRGSHPELQEGHLRDMVPESQELKKSQIPVGLMPYYEEDQSTKLTYPPRKTAIFDPFDQNFKRLVSSRKAIPLDGNFEKVCEKRFPISPTIDIEIEDEYKGPIEKELRQIRMHIETLAKGKQILEPLLELPIKEAKEELELYYISENQKKFSTSKELAKHMGIDPSTVSKKKKKLLKRQ